MDIINNMNITDKTKANYVSKYKKAQSFGINHVMSDGTIINKLDTIDDKPNNILAYLNVMLSIKKYLGMDVIQLKSKRSSLLETYNKELSYTNKNNLKTDLPTISDLVKYTEELYNDQKWKYYIINYLLLMVSCRNKDLDCIVTKIAPTDNKKNYLYLTSNTVEFIRNDYKTAYKYGTKTHVCDNKGFVYAVKQFLGNNEQRRLLTDHNTTNISKYVSIATYQGIGSGRYNKIAVREADLNRLIQIGNNRGTSTNVLLDNYFIDRKF
jgi:hypothetical protein